MGATGQSGFYGVFFYRVDNVGPEYDNETDIALRTWNTTLMYGRNQAPNGISYTTNISFDGAFHE